MIFDANEISRIKARANGFDFSSLKTLLLPDDYGLALQQDHDASSVIRAILYWCALMKISDITITPGMPIMVKRSNKVFRVSNFSIDDLISKKIILRMLNASVGDESPLLKLKSGDRFNTRYEFHVYEHSETKFNKPVTILYRVNVIPTGSNGVSLIARLNDPDIKRLEDIGQSEDGVIYKNAFDSTKGLTLITGPVDSGKTTLIFALLAHYIRYNPRGAFIGTVENPIEADLESVAKNIMQGTFKCPVGKRVYPNKVVNQTDISGQPNSSYLLMIPEFLRRNTDIMLLGEVRHSEEIDAVLTAVLRSGKLVFATMHTESACMTLDAIIYSMTSKSEGELRSKLFDLVSSLNMIVSQTLLENTRNGRVAVNETLVFTPELRKLIQDSEIHQITRKVDEYMHDNKLKMVHMAQKHLESGIISQDTFNLFKKSYCK